MFTPPTADQVPGLAGITWVIVELLKTQLNVDPKVLAFFVFAIFAALVTFLPFLAPFVQFLGITGIATVGLGAIHNLAAGPSSDAGAPTTGN